MESHALAEADIEHGGVRPHLLQEAQPGDDAVVEVDQLGRGQLVDFQSTGVNPSPIRRGLFSYLRSSTYTDRVATEGGISAARRAGPKVDSCAMRPSTMIPASTYHGSSRCIP